MDKYSLH